MKLVVVLLATLALFGSASLFRQVSTTNGWTRVSSAKPDDVVDVMIGVKQNNLELIEELFWKVSDPKSPMYTDYLTHAQIGELTFSPESTEAVISTLYEHKALDVEYTKFGEFVRASFRVADAEQLFNTEVFVYEHEMSETTILKAEGYVVPESLTDHMTHVAHLCYFPTYVPEKPMINASSATGYTEPDVITSYYGIDSSVTSGAATQAIFAALGQSYSDDDLQTFQQQFGMKQKAIEKVIGPNDASVCSSDANSCVEANLDVQYITSMAQNAPTWFWDISSSSADPFSDWVYAVADTSDAPYVHSMSYGGYEYDTSSMKSFNTELQKLALRGITVIIASGDDGVANFGARSDPSQCAYNPSFPATSPYATAVGATQGPEEGSDEVSCSSKTGGLITSGGGFSGVFDRPSYQDSSVSNFFNNVSPTPASGYNANGRGIPDVSAMGHNYVIADGGQFLVVSGTSASAPVFAGLITLINDARLQAGKQPLGFLNQALYSLDSSAFNDITSGDNYCCAAQSNPVCCSEGFTTTVGWDPVTGLGTPNFANFKAALVAL